jgi:hypothetical protein
MGEDLPAFTEEEKADLKGSIDFIGVHPYTARWGSAASSCGEVLLRGLVHAIHHDGAVPTHAVPGHSFHVPPLQTCFGVCYPVKAGSMHTSTASSATLIKCAWQLVRSFTV